MSCPCGCEDGKVPNANANPDWDADPMSSLERIGRGTPGGVYSSSTNGQQLARVKQFHPNYGPGPVHDQHQITGDNETGTSTLVSLDARLGGHADLGDPPDNDVVPAGSRW